MKGSPTLEGYLEASARRFPDRTAVVDPSGTTLTYSALEEQARRIAAFLAARGFQPGDRAGLLLPKSAAAVAAIFGILEAGGAYVPVDCTAPLARARSIFEDCQVRAVFVPQGSTAELPGAVTWEEAVRHEPRVQSHPGRGPDDLAYILYTSGSTGVPKGVMLTERNATSFVDWCTSVFRPHEGDRFSSHAPFHFDLSVLDIFLCIKHGAELHLVGEECGKNPRELAQFIAARRLTMWYSTPSILALLAEFGGLARLDASALRTVLFAGEVFPVKHLHQLTRLWPGPAYYNLYGPTETNVCTWARIPLPVPEERTEPYPIGRSCSHCSALVLDGEGRAVPPGEEGLLHIAGPSVFGGYWNRPEQNASVFLERDGRRWYNTGDVVREEPENGFVYLGRRDRMVKRRGYRIELGEIESALYRHEQLREAAAIATASGSGVKIVAFLTPRDRERPSIIGLKSFCARNLPAYMVPDAFVFLDALPRTSTNKVGYQELVSMLPRSA